MDLKLSVSAPHRDIFKLLAKIVSHLSDSCHILAARNLLHSIQLVAHVVYPLLGRLLGLCNIPKCSFFVLKMLPMHCLCFEIVETTALEPSGVILRPIPDVGSRGLVHTGQFC